MPDEKPRYIILSYPCSYCQIHYHYFQILDKTDKKYILKCYWCNETLYGVLQDVTQNLIQNPTFQPPYNPQDGTGELKVAQYWRAGWIQGNKQGLLIRPEYRQAAGAWHGQQFFTSTATMNAWLVQRVNVGSDSIGKYAKLNVILGVESQRGDGTRGDCFVSIGVCRQGHEDVHRKTVTWLSPVYQEELKEYTEIELIVPIENDHVSVFIQAENRWKVSTSVFIDSAELVVIDDPCNGQGTEQPIPQPGECAFDPFSILLAIQGTRDELAQAKTEILQAIFPTVKITDKLKVERE